MSLKISVITPALNCKDDLEGAILNVLDQHYPFFEHIVVDGGSGDGTLKVLKKYPHLKWISEPDRGQTHAMNKGYGMSTGDIIVFLNADDYFLPGAFEAVIPYFESGAKFVVGKIRIEKEIGYSFINDPRIRHEDMLKHWELNAFCYNAVGYFYRKEVIEKTGGFNENNYMQDLEFLLSASRYFEFTKIDRVLGVYRERECTITARTQRNMDYWSKENFSFIERFLKEMSPGFIKQYEIDREEGYKKGKEIQEWKNSLIHQKTDTAAVEKTPSCRLSSRMKSFLRSPGKRILLRSFLYEIKSTARQILWNLFYKTMHRRAGEKGKLNLAGQVYAFYGIHRSGWSHAMNGIAGLHNPHGVFLDSFIEKTFCWGARHNAKSYRQPWIGFIHNPPCMPDWFLPGQSNRTLFMNEKWRQSAPFCKGLFTLTEYHRKHLAPMLDIPVNALLHPTKTPVRTWNRNGFMENKEKKIVQIGFFLRKLYSIYLLPISGYQKVFLKKEDINLDELMKLEAVHSGIKDQLTPEVLNSVRVMKFLSNPAYDHLLCENIVFLDLHDASANNTILECIARNTPILVNRIEPVVEYLGEEYPLYFSSLQEAAEKAMDLALIDQTHKYLAGYPSKYKFTNSYFKESLQNSEIYQNL